MRMHKRVGVVFLLLVVTAATIAVLSPGRNSNTAATTTDAGIAPAEAGMRVYLDPETGEVGAEPDANLVLELDPELQNALRHDDEGLPTIKHANGAESINLDGRYQEATVVRIDENGKRIVCTDNIANVDRALNEAVSTAPEVK